MKTTQPKLFSSSYNFVLEGRTSVIVPRGSTTIINNNVTHLPIFFFFFGVRSTVVAIKYQQIQKKFHEKCAYKFIIFYFVVKGEHN